MNGDDSLKRFRNFLKDSIRKQIDFSQTDQNKGIDTPYREAVSGGCLNSGSCEAGRMGKYR